MTINIKSTKDYKLHGIKAVIYGAAGVGKTVLCSTAPNPIIISAEQGLLSLADLDVPYIEVSSVEEIGEAYKFLKNDRDFITINFDSLSEIAEVVLDEFKKDVNDPRQAYMHLATKFNAVIRNFRDLKDKNVIFTAKQKRIEDEYTGKIQLEPYLPGKVLPLNLPYLVDEVLHMDIGKSKEGEYRYLQCKAKLGVLAKDRSGKLNDKEPADLSKLFNKIRGN